MSTKRILMIEHVTQIMDCFTDQNTHLSLAELHTMTDLPKSTLHRILVSLVDQQILSFDTDTDRYTFGFTLLRWSAAMFNHLRIHDIARPYLTSLRDQSGETSTLTIRIGLQRMYIDQIQSTNEVRMSVEVGKLLSLYPGASGKAILSWLTNKEIKNIISEYLKQPNTDNSLSQQNLLEEFERIRHVGYSISAGERVKESASVSAPLFSSHGEIMGAIGLSGPSGRFSMEKAREFGPTLRDAAAEISNKTLWIHF